MIIAIELDSFEDLRLINHELFSFKFFEVFNICNDFFFLFFRLMAIRKNIVYGIHSDQS